MIGQDGNSNHKDPHCTDQDPSFPLNSSQGSKGCRRGDLFSRVRIAFKKRPLVDKQDQHNLAQASCSQRCLEEVMVLGWLGGRRRPTLVVS